MNKIQVILASGSPRRREILQNIGMEFRVEPTEADEKSVSPEGISVSTYVQELALIKAAACASVNVKEKNALIISADTVVCIDDVILGKPKDKEEAAHMIGQLSGRTHTVYTGFCVMSLPDGKSVCRACKTEVTFKELSDEKIRAYIETGEPMDKAGAYGIQGLGALLISEISGDYLNVVGLPVSQLADMLENEFNFSLIKE